MRKLNDVKDGEAKLLKSENDTLAGKVAALDSKLFHMTEANTILVTNMQKLQNAQQDMHIHRTLLNAGKHPGGTDHSNSKGGAHLTTFNKRANGRDNNNNGAADAAREENMATIQAIV